MLRPRKLHKFKVTYPDRTWIVLFAENMFHCMEKLKAKYETDLRQPVKIERL